MLNTTYKTEFSIIVPIYNTEIYIRDALDSLLSQSFENFEVIMVNDGSTDSSGLIAQEFVNRDARFSLISQNNAGVSSARNNGIEKAVGKYLYFFDSDDKLQEKSLEEWHASFQREDVDVLLFEADLLIDEDVKLFELLISEKYIRPCFSENIVSGVNFLETSLTEEKYFVSPCCYVFKKERLGKLRFLDGILHEDNLFFVQFLLKDNVRTSICNKKYFLRRLRMGSIMSSPKTYAHYYGLVFTINGLLKLLAKSKNNRVSRVLVNLVNRSLGDMCRTSYLISQPVAWHYRMRNLQIIIQCAYQVGMSSVGIKRFVVGLVPEIYKLK